MTKSLKATTTEQQDLTFAGQRRVNLIWEFTQGTIALIITAATIYCAVMSIDNQALTNGFFLIIGFYFSRTNHSQIGGIGDKPNQEYQGR